MSARALKEVHKWHGILGASAYAVAQALADAVPEDGREARCTLAHLQTATGFKKRTIQYALRLLEGLDIIQSRIDRLGRLTAQPVYTFPALPTHAPAPRGTLVDVAQFQAAQVTRAQALAALHRWKAAQHQQTVLAALQQGLVAQDDPESAAD